MKIGRSREVLINPNVQKFACAVMILTGWFWWPRESQYRAYEKKIKAEKEAEVR